MSHAALNLQPLNGCFQHLLLGKRRWFLIALESYNYYERVGAPEVISWQGRYYLAAYRPNGIWLAELVWTK